MKAWKELQEDVWKIEPNRMTAVSILKMVEVRKEALKNSITILTENKMTFFESHLSCQGKKYYTFLNNEKFTTIIVEDYYEIIKEIITAILEMDGFKTLSHEALIAYLAEYYKEFSGYDIDFLDRLRKTRHKIAYKGFFVEKDYLDRSNKKLDQIIGILTNILKNRLK
ncbi:MAG: hypothetical protein HZB65_00600 [Candidatus Aenigmarchaeota archaeon]|nr:hypothetical protein [Candidatus Aenigmarchaeota archaeon]